MKALMVSISFLSALDSTAFAEGLQSLVVDLNGNGAPEQYELVVDDDNIVTLRITEEGADPIEAVDFVWKGGLYGQDPELEVAPNGSVRVISQNEGCCRHRWRQTLTLAFRKDAIRVAGMTYQWRDTLNLDAYGLCDVNLLAGKGVTSVGERQATEFRVPATAPLVTDWSVDEPLPDACEIQ